MDDSGLAGSLLKHQVLLEGRSAVESDAKGDNDNRTDQKHYFCSQTHTLQ
jgi:hypothetical protein